MPWAKMLPGKVGGPLGAGREVQPDRPAPGQAAAGAGAQELPEDGVAELHPVRPAGGKDRVARDSP